jgi:hypothetical protein
MKALFADSRARLALAVATSLLASAAYAEEGHQDFGNAVLDLNPVLGLGRIFGGQFGKYPCNHIATGTFLGNVRPGECEALAHAYSEQKQAADEAAAARQAEIERSNRVKIATAAKQGGYKPVLFGELILRRQQLIGVKIAVSGVYMPNKLGQQLFADMVSAVTQYGQPGVVLTTDKVGADMARELSGFNRFPQPRNMTVFGRLAPCTITNGLGIQSAGACLSIEGYAT